MEPGSGLHERVSEQAGSEVSQRGQEMDFETAVLRLATFQSKPDDSTINYFDGAALEAVVGAVSKELGIEKGAKEEAELSEWLHDYVYNYTDTVTSVAESAREHGF